VSDDRCRRCGAGLGPAQEYCLDCGQRRVARPKTVHWLWPALVAGLVAAGGAAGAIVAGADDPEPATIVALSPLRAAPPATTGPTTLRSWPRRDGYTIVLAALPTTVGAEAARARALAAVQAGTPRVGVLASSRYASLHPGYWIVFSGVYGSLDEALAALPQAAQHARGAYAQEISR
jgi:hypothetical protein